MYVHEAIALCKKEDLNAAGMPKEETFSIEIGRKQQESLLNAQQELTNPCCGTYLGVQAKFTDNHSR